MLDSKNNKYWNIVKGLGIFSIVIGHSCYFLVPFVYLYHLALFFFTSGYFYSNKKYEDNLELYFLTKIKKNWIKYVIFAISFVLLHNVLFKFGFIVGNYYSNNEIVINSINSLFFFNQENMAGALWFIPVLIFSSLIFGAIVYYSNQFTKKIKNNQELIKNLIIIVLTVLTGLIGIYLCYSNCYTMFHSETCFIVVPFFTIGYFIRNYKDDLESFLKWWVFIPVFIVLLYISYKTSFHIDLSSNMIGSVLLFYPISLLGIYFCLYLSKIIYKIKYMNNYIELLGKYSFEIMASHFFVLKLIDVVYAKIVGISDKAVYSLFPYAFRHLWPIYIILASTIPALVFYFIDKLKKKKFISCKRKENVKNNNSNKNKIIDTFINYFKINKWKIVLVLLLLLCFSLPILKLGIMHNDELMSRYWSSQGFNAFYNHYFVENIQKGRALSSIINPVSMFLGFLGQKTYTFKLMQIVSLVTCAFLFSKLILKATKNKKISSMAFLLFLLFLQISFEPTAPNVFVTLFNVSICLLIYSFYLYIDYLESGSCKNLIISMVLFFIAELSYETFITYIPVYLLLYIYKYGFKNLFKDKKGIFLPIIMGIVFLVLYIISAKIFPSNYGGNQISNINILNSLNIIFYLSLYSLPGSYLLADKYRYLTQLFFKFDFMDVIRILIVVIIFAISIIYLFSTKRKEKSIQLKGKSVLKIVLVGFAVIVLPTLPISVASMYQTMDYGKNMIALPVTFFSYFGGILILSTLFVYVFDKYKLGKYIIFTVVLVVMISVQIMNSVFSRQANFDFKRLETIEKFTTSNIMKELNGYDIYSTDIFITKEMLFIHDNYWNEYTNLRGLNVNFINEEGKENDTKLYFLENEKIFIIETEKNYYLISEKLLSSNSSIYLDDEHIFNIKENYKKYNNYYIYNFYINKKEIKECRDYNKSNELFKLCDEK